MIAKGRVTIKRDTRTVAASISQISDEKQGSV